MEFGRDWGLGCIEFGFRALRVLVLALRRVEDGADFELEGRLGSSNVGARLKTGFHTCRFGVRITALWNSRWDALM